MATLAVRRKTIQGEAPPKLGYAKGERKCFDKGAIRELMKDGAT
jgi:hypothetical protein